jgi:hypothetical protein
LVGIGRVRPRARGDFAKDGIKVCPLSRLRCVKSALRLIQRNTRRRGIADPALFRSGANTITAEIEVLQGGAVLVSDGGRFGDYGFYLLKGRPVFTWNLIMVDCCGRSCCRTPWII